MRPKSASSLLRGPPLSLCDVIKLGYLQHVRDLVDYGMNIDCVDADGKTPLMLCAFVESEAWGVGIARNLIELGAILQLTDKCGLNALHYACIYERAKLAKVFLGSIDFDLNQRDKYGNTALHYAVTSGNMNMVHIMITYLRKYSLTLVNRNKRGLSALDIAHNAFDAKCIQMLEKECKEAHTVEHVTVTEKEISTIEGDLVADRQTNNGIIEETQTDDVKMDDDKNDDTISDVNNNVKNGLDVEVKHLSNDLTVDDVMSCPPTSDRSEVIKRRPRTALLTKRKVSWTDSSSTLSSCGDRNCALQVKDNGQKATRPKTGQLRSQYKTSSHKNAVSVITCLSSSDFRNNKEYIFRLTDTPYIDENNNKLPTVRRPHSAVWKSCTERKHAVEKFSWRKDFTNLFAEYELQCTPSWRYPAKPNEDDLYCSPSAILLAEEDDDKIKDRRGRRTSVSSRIGLFETPKRRPSVNVMKTRKTSSKTLDSATTSCESLASGSSLGSRKSTSKLSSETDVTIKNTRVPLPIPAVTETLVDDVNNNAGIVDDDVDDVVNVNRLTVIDEIS